MNLVCITAHRGVKVNACEKTLKFRVGRFSSKSGQQLEQWRDLEELHGWFGISSGV